MQRHRVARDGVQPALRVRTLVGSAIADAKVDPGQPITPALEVVDADRLDLPPAPAPALANRDPSRPSMLMYTSGTTGLPKGVLLSHASMLHAGRAVASHHGLGPADRVLSSLPLYHINGQCISTTGTLCSGGSIVMPHRFSVSQWWSLVARWRPTWLNLVPTIVAYLLNAPDPTPAEREAHLSLIHI